MVGGSCALGRAAAAGGIAFGTFLAACWLADAALPAGHGGSRAAQTEARRIVEQGKPDLVFLGNSMVADNVDGQQFERATGIRTARVFQHGSASAWWYLTLCDDLLAASEPPDVVVLVFRDHFLTHPSFRVLGPFAHRLREHTAWRDPLVYAYAYRPALGALAPLYRDVRVFRERDAVKRRLEESVKRAVEARLGIPSFAADQAIDVVFTDANIDPAQRTIRQEMAESVQLDPALFDFGERLESSFLPAMIRAARERGVRLVLVRAKKHEALADERTARLLERYSVDLAAYLDGQGVPLIDFSHDERIRPEHFSWGDHLTNEGRALFTKLLADELSRRGLLPGRAPGSPRGTSGS